MTILTLCDADLVQLVDTTIPRHFCVVLAHRAQLRYSGDKEPEDLKFSAGACRCTPLRRQRNRRRQEAQVVPGFAQILEPTTSTSRGR